MPIPYQDRLSGYPPTLLLNLASALSMSVLVMSKGYIYNFPLFLFGLVAHELHATPELLRQFLNLLFWSGIFDVFALLSNSESFFTKLFAFIVLILKLPIGVTCSTVLNERGGQFSVGGWIPGRAGGQANWTMPSMPAMPGGFNSTQSQGATGPANTGGNSAFPSSGGFRLGGEDESGGPPPAPAPGRNGYSSIA